jgi:hypothetical protein
MQLLKTAPLRWLMLDMPSGDPGPTDPPFSS